MTKILNGIMVFLCVVASCYITCSSNDSDFWQSISVPGSNRADHNEQRSEPSLEDLKKERDFNKAMLDIMTRPHPQEIDTKEEIVAVFSREPSGCYCNCSRPSVPLVFDVEGYKAGQLQQIAFLEEKILLQELKELQGEHEDIRHQS